MKKFTHRGHEVTVEWVKKTIEGEGAGAEVMVCQSTIRKLNHDLVSYHNYEADACVWARGYIDGWHAHLDLGPEAFTENGQTDMEVRPRESFIHDFFGK